MCGLTKVKHRIMTSILSSELGRQVTAISGRNQIKYQGVKGDYLNRKRSKYHAGVRFVERGLSGGSTIQITKYW
jgi:hypothetical protein